MADNETPTLRDSIMASMVEHGEPTESAPLVPAEPVAAPAEPQPAVSAAEQRARDEAGRFTKKTDAPAPAAAPQAPTAAPVAQAASTPIAPPPAESAPDTLAKPASWRGGEVEAKWAELPPAVQQEIHRREADYQKGISRASAQAAEAKPIAEVAAKYRPDYERFGAQPHQAVERLFEANRMLTTGTPQSRLNAFAQLAGTLNIPIQALYDENVRNQFFSTASVSAPQQTAAPVTPESVEALVERALAQKEITDEIRRVSSDTANYPYFQYLRPTIAQLLDSGEAGSISEAYKMAMEAPEHALLRGALQQQSAPQQQPASPAKVAAVARHNAVSPRSASPASPANGTGKLSLRDQITAAAEQHLGGGRV